MNTELSGKVAIITGAGRGIGREIALRLARAGAAVVIASRNQQQLQDVAQTISSEGGAVLAMPMDVTDTEAVQQLAGETVRSFRRIDILVNNAATNYVSNVILANDRCWKHVFEVNVFGTYACTKAVLPHMIRAKSGRIISVSSVAGKVGVAYSSAYSASKAAVIGFTKALAIEVAKLGITANAICPWHVDTEMMREAMRTRAALLAKTMEEQMADVIAKSPQRRLITAAEVAGLALFLCLPEAAGITGQALNQCGGAFRE